MLKVPCCTFNYILLIAKADLVLLALYIFWMHVWHYSTNYSLGEKKYVSSVCTPFEETYFPAYTEHKTNCINNILILWAFSELNFKHRLTTLHAAWTWCSVKTEIRSANIFSSTERDDALWCKRWKVPSWYEQSEITAVVFFFPHILTHHSSFTVTTSDSLFH